ncbi:MAG: DNA repair protein RecO [Rhodospirillaceae bacterium]|nr:DNA repair protein RecO [Rhodospirillaceae bacterium]|tara:strand:- start:10597 stop:11328 length:732 start_codon:yes stop_codon:yes gene_type:complete
MDWTDEGLVLSARRHGENSLIVNLLTREQGRHAGLVRGGSSTRSRGIYQPGNLLRAHWRGRLAEHLGAYTCELLHSHAADYLHEPLPLMALSASTAILDTALPERAPFPGLFEKLETLIGGLGQPGWELQYIRWELDLLSELGFGLDLTECAATGSQENLVYVSPRTGRAVSAEAGKDYHDRLLALPEFLREDRAIDISRTVICDGLALTGYFLGRHVMGDTRHGLPAARERLVESIRGDRSL